MSESADGTPDGDGAVDLPTLNTKCDQIAEDLKRYKKSADRDARDLWIGLLVLFAVGTAAIVLNDMFPRKTDVVTRDDTVEALLTPGVHCFDSHEEMAAARQRALAAIDRLNWEIDRPSPTSAAPVPYPVFQIQQPDPPSATVFPSRSRVVDATQPGLKKLDDRDVDNATCFGISKSTG